MKTLSCNGKNFQAEKIVKTSDSIIGYNGNSEVFVFRGISDFSQFQLEEGQTFDLDEKEQLEMTIANLVYELVMKDLTIQQMQQNQANLVYQLMMKGVL